MAENKTACGIRIAIADRLRKPLALLMGALQEIFDESAYQRFLTRRGIASSRQAYAEFLREGQAQRERRPRCC